MMRPEMTFALPPGLWESLRIPGLTVTDRELRELIGALHKEIAIFAHKESQPRGLLWVVLLGGTGTGKSTLFNALAGKTLSDTGVERPKTQGPILYMHRDRISSLESHFPFPSKQVLRISSEPLPSNGHERADLSSPRIEIPPNPHLLKGGRENLHGKSHTGTAEHFLVIEHTRDALAHLVLVDTPDLDSVALGNRQIAEDLYLFADVVVFVTSQEKYADHVPYHFLRRVQKDGKLFFLLLNKAEPTLTHDEALAPLRDHNLAVNESFFTLLPFTASDPAAFFQTNPEFRAFAKRFFTLLKKDEAMRLVQRERERSAGELSRKMQRLVNMLEQEQEASREWLERLEGLLQNASRNLIEQQHRHFTEESRRYLQAEIRKVFGKYDLLAKPRSFIRQVLLAPFRLFGWSGGQSDAYQVPLERIREKIDMTSIQMAIDQFCRLVLEKLSPADETAPLFQKIRQANVHLSDAEIRARIWQEQDYLTRWLEETFQKLAKGIPKTTEWGIYSTSIAWGVLILLLEMVVGGGISLTEAVLDSALAPFVTKGAVELFAYNELQKIARELAERYQNGLLSVLQEQSDRYSSALRGLLTSEQMLRSLRSLRGKLAAGRQQQAGSKEVEVSHGH
jgi:energy-coupling factor transporter ATP-binding protein EcfA2